MERFNKLVIRLNAGTIYGLGHLSRCISLVNEFGLDLNSFIIKTDNQELVSDFIYSNLKLQFNIIFIKPNCKISDELQEIYFLCKDEGVLVIVDHYEADIVYQEQLYKKNITWLQLDSHARIKFYATWVMHGSPGATYQLYDPLRLNPGTKFLLGLAYCIIRDKVLDLRRFRKIRTELKNVVLCFGGGDDRGSTIKCLKELSSSMYKDINFRIAINTKSQYFDELGVFLENENMFLIDPDDLNVGMAEADLAICAPGMISYEAAFLGLPMLLITIADNQLINSVAWEKSNCALNIGCIDDIEANLNNVFTNLLKDSHHLKSMSQSCLELVDGNGLSRIKREILK